MSKMSPTPSLPPVGGGSHPPLAELISRVGSAARSHCVTPRVLCCPHPSLKGTQQTMEGWHFSMAISSVSSRRNLCVACGTCHGSSREWAVSCGKSGDHMQPTSAFGMSCHTSMPFLSHS